jgi:hypothetical protein
MKFVWNSIDLRGNAVHFSDLVEKGFNVKSWLKWLGLLSANRKRKNIVPATMSKG